ncbi:nuclear transport factor 2 family protein [Gimesia aquarii]|uniref:SnoaL-like domain protein n=1 Tax=Gimesia aquarii TaxID=2527964 RepID=A0A517VSC7_9PLAN|nr:nuclear transport factor 2 family protein [Gimesia aquarii]QDT95916.1 SnoaL-like domain protein [Gimesia aquarii]
MKQYQFIDGLSPAIDTMVTKNVIDFLDEDCILQPGNATPVRGHAAITEVFDNLYAQIQSIKHNIIDDFAVNNSAVYRGTVTYKRLDGSLLTVPFCDVFKIKNNLISEYNIYIDWHQLFVS